MPVTSKTATRERGSPGRLVGRVALVTGASRSIGRAITERLATEGAHVQSHCGAAASNKGAGPARPHRHRLGAAAVAFLVSGDAAYNTRQCIEITGRR